VEINSSNPSDILGVHNCTVAPTAAADDPHAQMMVESSCHTGLLDARTHAPPANHIVRLSVRSFKFVGQEEVRISCIMVRCASLPCGDCVGGGRRLRELARPPPRTPSTTTAEEKLPAEVAFKSQLDESTIVLPMANDDNDLTLIFEQANLAESEQLTSTRHNLTLYGCPVGDSPRFIEALDKVLTEWLAVPTEQLKVLRVSIAGSVSNGSLTGEPSAGPEAADNLRLAEIVVIELEVANPNARFPADNHVAREVVEKVKAELGMPDLSKEL